MNSLVCNCDITDSPECPVYGTFKRKLDLHIDRDVVLDKYMITILESGGTIVLYYFNKNGERKKLYVQRTTETPEAAAIPPLF